MVCYNSTVRDDEYPFTFPQSTYLFNGLTNFSNRFLIITTAASVSAGYGIRGTMERGAYPTFEKVMNMDFGAPDPTSFTAYFLRHSVGPLSPQIFALLFEWHDKSNTN